MLFENIVPLVIIIHLNQIFPLKSQDRFLNTMVDLVYDDAFCRTVMMMGKSMKKSIPRIRFNSLSLDLTFATHQAPAGDPGPAEGLQFSLMRLILCYLYYNI